jgi:hypothetical protein
VYRVIELAQGWRGHLITTEWYFYVFDSTPMIICMLVWVIGHPGFNLEREDAVKEKQIDGTEESYTEV